MTDAHVEAAALRRLVAGWEDVDVAGWSASEKVTGAALAQLREGIRRQLRKASPGPAGLICQDALRFAAGLGAILGSGRDVIIAPDASPAVLEALSARVGVLVTDFDTSCPNELRIGGPVESDEGADEGADERAADGTPGILFFTSGSSGDRTMVRKSAFQLVHEAKLLEELWGPQMGEGRIIGTVSHQHLYGFLFRVVWPMITGRPTDGRTLEAHRVAETSMGALVSALVSCPAHLARLPKLVRGTPGFSGLPRIFSSGGPLDRDVALRCREDLGAAPIEVYGSTETGGIAWRQQSPDHVPEFSPFPSVALRTRGEVLEVKSAHADAGAEAWTATADRAEITPQGHVRLQGRVDRIVKILGKRVSLPEMESALRDEPDVDDVAVVARVDEDTQREMTTALVVLSSGGRRRLKQEGRRVLSQSLREALRAGYPLEVIPRRWRFLSEIPTNTQGKRVHAALAVLAEHRFDSHATELLQREQTREGDRVSITCDVPENLAYCEGHFPNAPIVAGVVQLGWVRALAAQAFGIRSQPASLEGVKFHSILRPGDRIVVALEWLEETRKLRYTIRKSEQKIASGVFVMS